MIQRKQPISALVRELQAGDAVLLWGLIWRVKSVDHPFVVGRAQLTLTLANDTIVIHCASALIVDKMPESRRASEQAQE